MVSSIQFFFSLSFSVTQAVLWNGALQTNDAAATFAQLKLAVKAPATTEAPRALKRRDVTSPQFCGWLWGVTPWNCDPFSTCIWRTDISAVGCCRDTSNMNTCRMYTTCVNSADLGSSTSTSSDSLVLRCTESANPICGSLRFEPSYYNFVCTDMKYFWDISLEFDGSTSISAHPRYNGPTTSSSSTNTTLTPPPSSTSSLKPVSTIVSVVATTTSSSSNKNIGAIAGGVVGGIAIISAIAVGVALFLRRRRRRSEAKELADRPLGAGSGFYHQN